MDLRNGELIGDRYEVLEPLGFGGAGDVYRVRDQNTEGELALKLLYEDQLGTEALRQRFLTEARIMAELQHPNVLPVYDLGEHAHRVWFVMEYASRGTVRELFDANGVDARLAAEIMMQVLGALQYAHENQCIHRDVKPANVLITQPDRFKLADFGVARYDAVGVARLTSTGDYLGTLGYMAPEQRVDPRNVVPQSDLYAAGATLFNLLSGHARPPPDLYAIPIDVGSLPTFPRALLPVIARATRARVADRYPDAASMRLALEEAIDQTWDETGRRSSDA